MIAFSTSRIYHSYLFCKFLNAITFAVDGASVNYKKQVSSSCRKFLTKLVTNDNEELAALYLDNRSVFAAPSASLPATVWAAEIRFASLQGGCSYFSTTPWPSLEPTYTVWCSVYRGSSSGGKEAESCSWPPPSLPIPVTVSWTWITLPWFTFHIACKISLE
jgi:hypothetical protein